MMLTTKARYAVMAMVDIASLTVKSPVCLNSIAERQQISINYLEQIFSKLKKANLVKAIKGPGGGYVLDLDSDKIFIANIVEAVDEPIKMTRCNKGEHGCMRDHTTCLTHDLWDGLGLQIFNYLNSVSLADICQRKLGRNYE